MTSATAPARRSRPPLWLVEGLDVVEQRRPAMVAVTLAVATIGLLLTVLAPSLVPPVPLVGAAVGLAALLLGLAVAIALDAADLTLRGPRHVGAAGGELVAVLPSVASAEDAVVLADAVLEAREPGMPLLLGLAASGRDVRSTTAWTDALGTALEAQGVSVLRIDLASGHSEPPGLVEVVRDGVSLASAVRFGPERRLARLGAGGDHRGALESLSAVPSRLPRDLDVLLVALPTAASRQVVDAVRSLDHVLIVAQRDRTSRVELIAALDALESSGTHAQVALLDDRTAARLTAPAARSPEPAPEEAHRDAEVGAEPASAPVPDQLAVGVGDAGPEVGAEPASAPVSDQLATGESDPADSERRVPALVDGAAEATAIALADTPTADPAPQADEEASSPTVIARSDTAADGATSSPYPGPTAEPRPSASLEPDTDHRQVATDPDATDEIPRVDVAEPDGDDGAEHDEIMRTTAQLAVLLDDLGVPQDERSDPAR